MWPGMSMDEPIPDRIQEDNSKEPEPTTHSTQTNGKSHVDSVVPRQDSASRRGRIGKRELKELGIVSRIGAFKEGNNLRRSSSRIRKKSRRYDS